MDRDAFSIIKGRYLAILWLLPFIYMPGIESLTYQLLDSTDEWYWYDIIYYYYFHVVMLIGLLVMVYFGKPNWCNMFEKFQQKELLPSLKLTAFIFIFSIATSYIFFYPLSFIIPGFVEYWYIDIPPFIYADLNTYPIVPNLLSFISLVIIAPILEEFVFRGLLLHRWNKKWGIKYAIILSSLLFGVMHPDPIGATAFGVAMCILYLRTQSLWVPIICHAINNLVAWLLAAGWFAYYGSDHIYTIQDFQNDWQLGLITSILVILWIYIYMKNPKTYRTWCLPNA